MSTTIRIYQDRFSKWRWRYGTHCRSKGYDSRSECEAGLSYVLSTMIYAGEPRRINDDRKFLRRLTA